jgi:HSP20 family protein
MQVVRFNYPSGYYRVNPYFAHPVEGNDRVHESKFQPKVNILYSNEAYVLQFAVPGYKKEHFSVTNHNNELLVKASVESNADGSKYQHREFDVLSFERRFKMAHDIEHELIVASYSDGVLTVTLPKKAQPVPREIDVKVN